MKRAQVRRRVLYVVTGVSWLAVGYFSTRAVIEPDTVVHRVFLMVSLMVAGCLTTASLFAACIAPLHRIYRAGFKDGQRNSGCSMFRPILTSVDNDARSATVTSLRLTRSDN
jgi:hypothetical protein